MAEAKQAEADSKLTVEVIDSDDNTPMQDLPATFEYKLVIVDAGD